MKIVKNSREGFLLVAGEKTNEVSFQEGVGSYSSLASLSNKFLNNFASVRGMADPEESILYTPYGLKSTSGGRLVLAHVVPDRLRENADISFQDGICTAVPEVYNWSDEVEGNRENRDFVEEVLEGVEGQELLNSKMRKSVLFTSDYVEMKYFSVLSESQQELHHYTTQCREQAVLLGVNQLVRTAYDRGVVPNDLSTGMLLIPSGIGRIKGFTTSVSKAKLGNMGLGIGRQVLPAVVVDECLQGVAKEYQTTRGLIYRMESGIETKKRYIDELNLAFGEFCLTADQVVLRHCKW